MPDLIAPSFSRDIPTPQIQAPLDTGNKPANNVPDIFDYISPAFAGMQDISLNDFSKIINDTVIPSEDKQKRDIQTILNSLGGGLEKKKDEPSFRYFKSADAMRYKQNDRLWNTYGFNPETPEDITDTIYDFHETTWESFKNVMPKLWNTTKFAYGNYFAEYYDAARAIGKLDANALHDANRFTEYNERQREFDATHPDYKTDKEVKWYQLGRGDFWEESGSSLGFTIGTIGAALTENIGITLATGGLGEFGELYNTPRKIFKAISEYYSLKRAYSLTKAVAGNTSLLKRIGSAAQLWRLTNAGLSEAAFEGATNAWEYMNVWEQNFIEKNGRKPTKEESKDAKSAANSMANATILFQTPFLMASNAVQFGNLIAPKSFSRLLGDVLGKKFMGKFGEGASKLANVAGKTEVVASEEVAKNLFAKYGKKALRILRNPLWEGTEESYQALVTTTTQKYYGDKYLTGEDASLQASLGAGWNYVTSNQGMKEFAAGFATGAIFKIGGAPVHYFSKPKVRTPDEQTAYKKDNPEASDLDAKYKTNFLNTALGFGMKNVNEEREAANLQKMADQLNSVDLEKFVKEEGFLSLLKDKQTAFALAKYLQNNDQFNMQNTQSLQLMRFLYAGLATGKIDLQIDKLKSFASQDFKTLSNFFELDENDYTSQDEQDQFVNNLRMWTNELEKKSTQFEKIYDKQKSSFKPILQEAARENAKVVNDQNEYLLELKKKYDVEDIDKLNEVVTPVEKGIHNKLNEAAIATHTRYYAVNEAIKASIFSQVGMDDSAQKGRDIVSQLIDNNTVNISYHELGNFFDIGWRETRLRDLEGKVESAKATNDPNIEIYEQQLTHFKNLTKILDNQFNKGTSYKESKVADAIQEYLVSVEREINKLDNSTDLETRIKNEMSGQFDLLIEFVKLQRKHQENLNLWNYLTSQANRGEYINWQSHAIKEFFSQAIDLNKKDKRDAEANKPVVPEETQQPAQGVPAAALPPPPNIGAATTVVDEAEIVETEDLLLQKKKNKINDFITAIVGKRFQDVADMRGEIATYPRDFALERVNYRLSASKYTKPEVVDAIKKEFTDIFGEDFFNQVPTVTPTVVEISKKLDALTERFLNSGKTQKEAEDLALQSITEEERQILRDSYKASTQPVITPDDIHKLAKSKNIPWDNDPAFIQWTKDTVGRDEGHLDKLTPEELQIVYNALEKRPTQEPKADVVGSEVDDIEKRRKADLDKLLSSIDETDEEAGEWLKSIGISDENSFEGLDNDGIEELLISKINAKYDAELAALKEPVAQPATGLLAEILPKITDPIQKKQDLQYFIDKAGENPVWAEETLGKELAAKLLIQVPTDKLIENYNFVAKVDEKSPVAVRLDEIIGEREKEEKKEEVEEEPEEIDEIGNIPPTEESGETIISPVAGPLGVNYISDMIDDAREGISMVNGKEVKGDAYFVFDARSSKEIDKIEENLMTLKSASDPMALKHHRIMEMLDKIFAEDTDEQDNFKIKLEKLTKDNEKWFYQADDKVGNMLAMIVDSDGNYHYFDGNGQLTTKENGQPFGVEYQYRFYREEELSSSRHSMNSDNAGQTITPNYGKNTNPLSTIHSLLAKGIPVYGSILGITSGTLSTLNNNNTFNNRGITPKMRTLQELFDSGELSKDELMYVKVRGFLINYAGRDQRVKVGRPMIVDRETGLNIPLTGRKLKDITFNGVPISKTSQLYEVIDFINRNGYIRADSLRPDKTRIIENEDDIDSIYHFLRELLYSKLFRFHRPSSNEIVMTRNLIDVEKGDGTNKAAKSLWDTEINYIDERGPLIAIPFTEGSSEIDYQDFLAENFETGAIKAVVEKGDVRFTKINKRIIFRLDDTHAAMEKLISQGVNKSLPKEVTEDKGTVEMGDLFYFDDPTKIEIVIGIEGDTITKLEDGLDEEDATTINREDLLKWNRVAKLEKRKESVINDKQQEAIAKIKALPRKRIKSTYRVTHVSSPFKPNKREDSSSLVMGNVIDHIAKNIFLGGKVSPNDEVVMSNAAGVIVKGTLGGYLLGDTNLDSIIKVITAIKNSLEDQGNIFMAGVIVNDEDSELSGEIDLLIISPEGEVTIADFKTSREDFTDKYMAKTYSGVSNKEYFATQGYLYGLMLAKQAQVKVSPKTMIIGLPISFKEGANAFDSKLNIIREQNNYIHEFTNSDVYFNYKLLTSVKKIIDKYNKLINQTSTSRRTLPRDDTPLSMKIVDINLLAANDELLKEQVKHMAEMLGEDFVVKFVNEMNKYKYGEWTINGTTLWKNAISGTPYHEGWHQFSQLFLTQDTKIKTYDNIRKESIPYIDRYGNKMNTSDHTDMEIEEFLADEWVKYVQSRENKTNYSYPGKQKGIIGFFKRLWQLLKNWFSPSKDPQSLFRNLYNGKYKRRERTVNNAIWGNLTSSILNNKDEEILSHSRTHLYIQMASYFIGEILDERDLSFTWLKSNIKNQSIYNKLFYKFHDLQDVIMDNLSTITGDPLQEILDDDGDLVARTVKEKNITPDKASMLISQVREIEKILGEDDGAFDNFYDYYIRNSDIDTIRQDSEKLLEFNSILDDEEVIEILGESGDTDENSKEDHDEESNKGRAFKEGPNDKSPFVKASKEIKDFFRAMGIVHKIVDGEFIYLVNEFGIPLTYDYASIFNLTKNKLSGKDTIEKIMLTLSNKHIQKNFPQAKLIHDKLQRYMDNPTPANISFIRRFTNVMSMPEVDNLKLSIDEDALLKRNEGKNKSLVKMRSQSRTGQINDINGWEYSFNIPTEDREGTKITDTTSNKDIFFNDSKSNIIYNIDGVIKLNPFYNYSLLEEGMDSKEFLTLMGINLHEEFWNDSLSVEFADRVKSLMLKDLAIYKTFADFLLWSTQVGGAAASTIEELNALKSSDIPNKQHAQATSDYFIDNPINYFKERKTYPITPGKTPKTVDTISIYPALADLSTRNSIFSLSSPSRQFTDGGNKTKSPYYEPSLITRRTQLLNDIQNVKEFNNNLEFLSLNPNTCPWIKSSYFYRLMFSDGKRNTISGKLNVLDGSNETVKIEIADLSSYEVKSEGKYVRKHPKDLSAQEKLYFDIVTLIFGGRIEVPRAATSSSIMSISMNSYDVKGKGDSVVIDNLPIKITSAIAYDTDKFRIIMSNNLVAELQKLKWYFTKNPNAEVIKDSKGEELAIDSIERNYYSHNLNVFKDILSPELSASLIKEVKGLSGADIYDKVQAIVEKNHKQFFIELTNYFRTYVNELLKGDKNANIEKMSYTQKKVLKKILSLYKDKSKSLSVEDIKREARIAGALELTGEKSAFQTAREAESGRIDSGLNIIASVFAVNQFILNIEYHTWYMGDNYLFNNPFKRGNLATNTGPTAVMSPWLNNVLQTEGSMHYIYTGKNRSKFDELKTMVIKEVITQSKYYDNIINDLINLDKIHNPALNIDERRKELEKEYAAYKKIKSADGQAKISLDAYRRLRIIYGNWNEDTDQKEYERQLAILRLRNNLYFSQDRKPLKKGDLAAARERDQKLMDAGPHSFFNPQKFAYTGPEIVKDKDGNNIPSPMRTKFDKMSLHPLLPEYLAGSGYSDEKLMMEMAINDVDYAKFESASKAVKHESLVEFFDEDGFLKNPSLKLIDFNAEYLLSSYLKNQLSTEGFDQEDTFGSQQRVMFFDVIYQAEVQNDAKTLETLLAIQERYLSSVRNIMAYQRSQFFNRFGMEETVTNDSYSVDIVNEERFASAIASLAKTNNFPDNMRQYLKYDKDGQYYYDASLVFNRKMLIDNIGGIIDGDLRRLKTKGASPINVTSVGNTSVKYTNPTLAQIKEYGTNGLHYYHLLYDNERNPIGVSTMGIKMTIQGDFKHLLNLKYKGEHIKTVTRLNEAILDKEWKGKNMDKLTFVGYRIPTNDNNFIDHVEVMEFLPESSGNIVIAPPEHIIKTGGDFDVDKTHFIFPSINSKGELATEPKENIKDIYEQLNTITPSIRDYNNEQRDINNALKRGKEGMRYVEKKWRNTEMRLRQDFDLIDSSQYWGMEDSGKTFYEIVAYFKPFLIDYIDSQRDLDTFLKLDKKLKDEKWKTTLKLDEKFTKLLKEINSFKDYHTNSMLQAMKDGISHPAYYRMLVSPSNTKYLVDQANRIAKLTNRTTKDNSSSSENTKQTTVNTVGENFLKANIGPWSIQRRWFSLLNFSEMKLNRIWKYGYKIEYDMRIITPLASLNEKNDIATDDHIMMFRDNLDGISPRKIWDMFMSSTIDLPSNTYYTLFGINDVNKKITQYLIASRYSLPKVISFINQPVLQEVYNLYNSRSKELENYSLKSALVEISTLYGIRGGMFKELQEKNIIKDERGNQIAADPMIANPGVAATKLLEVLGGDDISFSQDEMDEDIKNPTKTAEFMERQKLILLYFMVAHLEASEFTGMQFAFSEDRNKDTNYFTIKENDKKKEDIRGKENDNIPISGSMFSKTSITKLEKHSIYTPFTYSAVAKVFYEKFAKEFTSLDVVIEIQRILNNTSVFGIDKQLLATRIEGDFIEFIYKNFGTFSIDVYDPMSDTISRSTDKFGEYFLKTIFNVEGEENFHTYSAKFIKFLAKYPELRNISFIERLHPEGIQSKSVDDDSHFLDAYRASVLRFTRSQDNTVSERNHYANELENLMAFGPASKDEFKITRVYEEEDYRKISAFFTELAYLTLYQSGPTNIADNFSDLLPATFWQQFSSKAFENYHNAIDNGDVRINELMKMFSMLYTQNNPKVPWKSHKMMYSLTYYGEAITKERRHIYRNKKIWRLTQFFRNFRAGKMYDIKRLANFIKFTGISEIKC